MGTLTNDIVVKKKSADIRHSPYMTPEAFVESGTAKFSGKTIYVDAGEYLRNISNIAEKKPGRPLSYLDEAFYWITNANDRSFKSAERSNLFDYWKDALENTVAKREELSISQREILGSLIVASKNKDVTDFDHAVLNVFQEATNNLRQNRAFDVDSKRIVDSLLDAGCSLTIPLAIDKIGQDEEVELDAMMKIIIEKSRETD